MASINPRQSGPFGDFKQVAREAAAAERAGTMRERSPSRRIASLICEIASRVGGRRWNEMPLSRQDIADLLGLSLVRVKRGLALLGLSGIAICEGSAVKVLDWRRLCAAGAFDPARLSDLDGEDEDLEPTPFFAVRASQAELQLITASGEQAFFG